MERLPVLDAHMHLDPLGMGRRAIAQFKRAGGTHVIIVNKPYHHIDISSAEDYARSYDVTEKLTLEAREEGIGAWCVLGPYPVEILQLAERFGIERAVQVQEAAVREAASRLGNGTVIGLGEVGRIHFPVESRFQAECDVLLEGILRTCKETGTFAVLHTDSPSDNPELMAHLARICDRAGLDRKFAIKHYSGGELADPVVNMGLTPSILSTRPNILKAIEFGSGFLMETDFIDESSRPDSVLPPDAVPKRIKWLINRGSIDEVALARLMIDLPREVMGIDTNGA